VTDWLREAYELSDVLTARAKTSRPAQKAKHVVAKARPKPKGKDKTRKPNAQRPTPKAKTATAKAKRKGRRPKS
jgi:hypothetical protein